MFKPPRVKRRSRKKENAMVKKLILLWVLMTASGLGGENVNPAATGGTPGERLGARSARESGTEHQIQARDEKNPGEEKKLLHVDPTDEVEMKRLKLIVLLVVSLDQYRTPVH